VSSVRNRLGIYKAIKKKKDWVWDRVEKTRIKELFPECVPDAPPTTEGWWEEEPKETPPIIEKENNEKAPPQPICSVPIAMSNRLGHIMKRATSLRNMFFDATEEMEGLINQVKNLQDDFLSAAKEIEMLKQLIARLKSIGVNISLAE
jgi:hypothetical protein